MTVPISRTAMRPHIPGSAYPSEYAHDTNSTHDSASLSTLGSTVIVIVLGIYLIRQLLMHFGYDPSVRSLLEIAWNSFVYMMPSPIVFAFDPSQSPYHNEVQSSTETNAWAVTTESELHASKSQVLQKVFGFENGNILKGLSGDRSLRAIGGLLSLGTGDGDGVPPGLGNWDNSCYQNSVIQGLTSLHSLRNFLANAAPEQQQAPNESTLASLRDTLEKLSNADYNGQRLWTPAKLKSMSSWQQQDAQEYFSKVMDEVEKDVVRASVGKRELTGIEEFPQLGGQFEASSKPERACEDADSTMKRPSSTAVGPTRTPLDGLLAQRVGCTRCGYSEGLSLIPFNCLTVPLSQAYSTKLESCLSSYTELEFIEDVECPKCTLEDSAAQLRRWLGMQGESKSDMVVDQVKARLSTIEEALEEDDFTDTTIVKKCAVPKKNWSKSTKSRQAVIARQPESLVVHINRSVFDEFTGAQRKNYAEVEFPKTLDLWPWCLGVDPTVVRDETAEMEQWSLEPSTSMLKRVKMPSSDSGASPYQLRAVVTHYGRHENGHYICYRQHPRNIRLEEIETATSAGEGAETASGAKRDNGSDSKSVWLPWWRLSDDDVSPVSEREVLQQGGVFMLFYERTSGQLTASPHVNRNPPTAGTDMDEESIDQASIAQPADDGAISTGAPAAEPLELVDEAAAASQRIRASVERESSLASGSASIEHSEDDTSTVDLDQEEPEASHVPVQTIPHPTMRTAQPPKHRASTERVHMIAAG